MTFVSVGKHFINLEQVAYVTEDLDHKERPILVVALAGDPVPRFTIPHEYAEAFEKLLRDSACYLVKHDGYTVAHQNRRTE